VQISCADQGYGSEAGVGTDRTGLASLREEIARLERGGGMAGSGGAVLRTGFEAVDAALPEGGLALGAVHEITGPACDGFALHLLVQATGPVLWCMAGQGPAGDLYGPGLSDGGFDTGRLMLCRAGSGKDCLWAMEEALRSSLLYAVVGEPDMRVDLTASRRLQLAAERGRTLGLVLGARKSGADQAGSLNPSAVHSRWHAAPASTGNGEGAAWHLSLQRCRGGGDGSWQVSPALLRA